MFFFPISEFREVLSGFLRPGGGWAELHLEVEVSQKAHKTHLFAPGQVMIVVKTITVLAPFMAPIVTAF